MNTTELIARARLRAQTDSTHDAMLTELTNALEYTEESRWAEQEAARDFHKQLREWVLLVERNNDLLPAGNNLIYCLEVFFAQVRESKKSESTPIGELMAAPMKAAVWPQPNGCTCYCQEPTVPKYRDANDHLSGCPAKGIAAMERVMSRDAQRMNELQAQIDRLHTALDGAKTERDEARDTLAEGLTDAERIVGMTKAELTLLRAVIEQWKKWGDYATEQMRKVGIEIQAAQGKGGE